MHNELTGTRLGDYTVGRLIGDGGMGSVFQATRPGVSDPLAIKVLLPDLAQDAEFRARFEREAAILSRMQHPHIVPVYAVGEDRGYLYFVMRFVRGLSLYELLQRRRFSPLAAWQILNPIAQALDYAHERGIIHRDIKPGNILIEVTQVDGRPHNQVFLADFGLSKVAGWRSLTQTGISVGTPQYMSPEQVRNEALTPASDVYALALVLYEMLLGRWPFYDHRPEQIALKHITDAPPAPTALHRAFPKELEAVILRGLHKAPPDRYPTAGEFAAAYAEAVRALSSAARKLEYWVGPPASY